LLLAGTPTTAVIRVNPLYLLNPIKLTAQRAKREAAKAASTKPHERSEQNERQRIKLL
jgi:hypothetical protein